MTEDWFDIAKDITSNDAIGKTPEEAYEWLLFCITEDIKEALNFVPLEVLLHDLERRGVDLNDYSQD